MYTLEVQVNYLFECYFRKDYWFFQGFIINMFRGLYLLCFLFVFDFQCVCVYRYEIQDQVEGFLYLVLGSNLFYEFQVEEMLIGQIHQSMVFFRCPFFEK